MIHEDEPYWRGDPGRLLDSASCVDAGSSGTGADNHTVEYGDRYTDEHIHKRAGNHIHEHPDERTRNHVDRYADKYTTGRLTVPVNGTGGGGTFAGTLQIQRFASQNGQVAAFGLLSGTVTTGNGIATSIVKTVSLPAAVTGGTCDALNLELGSLSVDLAGLQVALSRVLLDLSAQSISAQGPGTVLCSVANVTNDPSTLAIGLNNILDLIRYRTS